MSETRAALRREIGAPTERDHLWQPMVAASEVRELLDALDVADARLAAVEALVVQRDVTGMGDRMFMDRLRAALRSDPSEATA